MNEPKTVSTPTVADALRSFRIIKRSVDDVIIENEFFEFVYWPADAIVKQEFKGNLTWFGGLQCVFEESTPEYKQLAAELCRIAKQILRPAPVAAEPENKWYAVEFAGCWYIQNGPFYEDENVLDAEFVGEEKARANAALAASAPELFAENAALRRRIFSLRTKMNSMFARMRNRKKT